MNLDRLMSSGRRAAPRHVSPGLTDAERARTMIAGSSSVRVGVLNSDHDVPRHAVMSDGSVLFMAPPDSPTRIFAVARHLPAQTVDLTAQDVAHVPQTDRIRGSLTLRGQLGPAPEGVSEELRRHLCGPDPFRYDTSTPMLRLVPSRVWMRWSCELDVPGGPISFDVPCEEYEAASADPFVEQEAWLLTHLFEDHRDLVHALAERADVVLGPEADPRPLALDRYGIVLRLYADGTHHDRRVPFRHPVSCECELERELELLTMGLEGQTWHGEVGT